MIVATSEMFVTIILKIENNLQGIIYISDLTFRHLIEYYHKFIILDQLKTLAFVISNAEQKQRFQYVDSKFSLKKLIHISKAMFIGEKPPKHQIELLLISPLAGSVC